MLICLLAFATQLSAESVSSVVRFHDYTNAQNLIQEHFDALYQGKVRSRYRQGGGCSGSTKFYESWHGVRDEAALKVTRIMLMGKKEQAWTSPAYLVDATRRLWNGREFRDFQCTYLVSFQGDEVNKFMEMSDLHYLFEDE